ncbi:MFS transporter [Actinoplanes derwentensis]|uniref:Predicted arabinose efflux permease, MFS family n=1 Tax=Actinoplanes derwentensis TaxID=113562 RepID=A0A1H1WF31_9ACTN|nr:MFS transporter [Actinoplanes derwentensis]GID87399.1 MFS transporter [Actinoplanes derwentensis]SDS95260.1 Predicted arabinose efflux permease, MFS family [Actinoplanes derwentensis]
MTTLAVPPGADLLWHRDFRLFWAGQTTSRFGSSITSVALPLVAVGTLHASTMQVAMLQAAAWVPWLLIGLPAGVWVDRLPRRPVLLVCDLVGLTLLLSVPVAAWLGVLGIGQLLAVALLAGVVSVFFQTAYQVYLPSLLDTGRLAEGNARLQGSEASAQVAGPGAAGLLAQAFGAVAGLAADAVTFLISGICLLAMRHREPDRTTPAARRALRSEIGAGLRFLIRDPYLRVMALYGAVANLAMHGYQAILIVFLIREVGLSPGTVGLTVAAMSTGGVVGALLATRIARRFGTAHGMLLCQIGAAPFTLLIPMTGPGARLALLITAGVVIGAGVVAANVIKGSFRQAYTPRHLLGRVLTGMQLLNYGTIPVGALLGGVLGTTLGLRPALWLTTGLTVAATGILLLGPIREHRDLPSTPVGSGGS